MSRISKWAFWMMSVVNITCAFLILRERAPHVDVEAPQVEVPKVEAPAEITKGFVGCVHGYLEIRNIVFDGDAAADVAAQWLDQRCA